MVQYCSVPQCKSKQVVGSIIKFHKFPDNPEMLARLLRVLKIKRKSNKNSKVCSLHFKQDHYKDAICCGDVKRYLGLTAVPTENLPEINEEPRMELSENSDSLSHETDVHVLQDIREEGTGDSQNVRYVSEMNVSETDSDSLSYETDVHVLHNNIEQGIGDLQGARKVPDIDEVGDTQRPRINFKFTRTSQIAISLYYNRLSDEQFIRYTGLSYNRFELLFSFLAQSTASPFDKYLSKRDQLILCLIKYRQNIIFSIIGDMYGIPLLTTRQIFIHWVQIMNAAFKAVNWWSLRYVKQDAYTVILDCCELATQYSTKNPELSQHLFSQQKNKNTLKYLVGMDEKGIVIFCSDVYCGSVSARSIVKECGIIDKLSEGDTVLLYRDFDVSDLLESKSVDISLLNWTRRPGSIARAIFGLANYNKLLSQKMHSILWPCANEVIFVGNILNNFRKDVV